MPPFATRATPSPWLASVVVVGVLMVLIAQTVTIGADTMWLVAMGSVIAREGGIPVGVPFAAAGSDQWVNVPVLAELVFAGVNSLGTLGLPALQLVVDAGLLALIALGARRLGARDLPTAAVLLITALGILPSLGVVRSQLLSLVPFALLVLLLRSEHEKPSRRIWLLIPLVALWGNLHGAVLVGVAMAGCYLVLSRMRIQPLVTVTTGIATLAALWATPARLHTGNYYLGVLGNEAARRGVELWSAPRLDRPLDVLMLVASAALCGLVLARRRHLWEYAALAGLSVATITSARHGVWLLLFVSAPAAANLALLMPLRFGAETGDRRRGYVAASIALGMVVLAGGTLWPRATDFRIEVNRVAEVKRLVGDSVVLAPEPLAESLAAGGVRLWMCNPIDAFSRSDQSAYLDFVSGEGTNLVRALALADEVVAEAGSVHAELAARSGFVLRARVDNLEILRRAGTT